MLVRKRLFQRIKKTKRKLQKVSHTLYAFSYICVSTWLVLLPWILPRQIPAGVFWDYCKATLMFFSASLHQLIYVEKFFVFLFGVPACGQNNEIPAYLLNKGGMFQSYLKIKMCSIPLLNNDICLLAATFWLYSFSRRAGCFLNSSSVVIMAVILLEVYCIVFFGSSRVPLLGITPSVLAF